MAQYKVQDPSGNIRILEGPDGATDDQVIAAAHQTFGAPAAPTVAPSSYLGRVKEGITGSIGAVPAALGNMGAGAIRGAGSIGATVLTPVDAAARAAGVQNDYIGRTDRRTAMDSGLRELGADPNSLAFKTGKLGAEAAGVAGVGGALAAPVRGLAALAGVSEAAAPVANALATSGMSTGTNALSGAANLGIRSLGAAASGGAGAGLVNPENARTGAIVGALTPSVLMAAGKVGQVASDGAQAGAKRLMQSALKPTIASLRNGEAETAVDTLLKYGINPTEKGVQKLKDLVSGLNDDILSAIGDSSATIDKQKVLNALADTRQKFVNQVSPTSDLNAISNVESDFLNHPNLPGQDIPVQAAQQIKQGTYRVLDGKYGQLGSAETEAQKSLARGLKDEIATAVPAVAPLNAEESRLLSTLNVSERRALMDANKNPLGLAALAHNPVGWAAFMADKSAAFKSLAARALNAASNGLPQSVNALAAPAVYRAVPRSVGAISPQTDR